MLLPDPGGSELTGGQCVLGTLVDAYFRGYDCITVEDCIATTSPPGALESVLYNAGGVRQISPICPAFRS